MSGSLLRSELCCAAESLLDLSWEAPEECGSADVVRGAVASLVRGKAQRPLQASLRIRRDIDGYIAELRAGAEGIRVMQGPSCQSVLEGSIVVLALAIEPSTPQAQPRREEPADRGRPASPARSMLSVSPPSVGVGLGPILDTATLPHVAAGLSLRASLRARGWSVALRGNAWLPASRALPGDTVLGARFNWWTLGLSGCIDPVPTTPSFNLCLTPEWGSLRATATGVETSLPRSTTWFSVLLEPVWAVPLNARLRLLGSAGVALTVLGGRPFVIERAGLPEQVHRPARFSGRVGLGLELLF